MDDMTFNMISENYDLEYQLSFHSIADRDIFPVESNPDLFLNLERSCFCRLSEVSKFRWSDSEKDSLKFPDHSIGSGKMTRCMTRQHYTACTHNLFTIKYIIYTQICVSFPSNLMSYVYIYLYLDLQRVPIKP